MGGFFGKTEETTNTFVPTKESFRMTSEHTFIPVGGPMENGTSYGSINGESSYINLPGEDPNVFFPVGSANSKGVVLGPTWKCSLGGLYCGDSVQNGTYDEAKKCTFCGPTGDPGINGSSY